MESVRRAVKVIAYTRPPLWLSTLSPSHLSLIPFLSLASSLYSLALRLRHQLYRFNILHQHRFPVPVIAVGNLTWGGNGKTPMVEFLARAFADDGISPLILTRGYGGADEARMLQRQLQGTSAKIGIGANRAATAARFLEQKHLSVWRDLEIVMVNAMMPWGNHQLIPLGPLREPLTALSRADIVVIHHADLVQEKDIDAIISTIHKVNKSVPIFFTVMAPIHFVSCQDVSCKVSLSAVKNMAVLCLSGIGFADSFVRSIEKMAPSYVDRVDFSDNHVFQLQDLEMVRKRLEALESKCDASPILVITEKDYDRGPEMVEHLRGYQVLVLCSRLQFVGSMEDRFRELVKDHLCLYTS